MWGLSYGGFTSIQVAATRPPHLRAIVAIQATDDRYTDDVHYVGGAMTVSELAQYAVSQVAQNAMPPLPSAWGPGWLDGWRARLEATPVWLFEWARQQRDGPYWRRGSLAPDYERIEAAVLQFAGWMDEYVDAALRIQARCTRAAGRRTIVGPWVHGLPDHAYPAPNIDWLHEAVRWFDRWLKDDPNGADAEPALTWFHRDPTPPERFPKPTQRGVARDECLAARGARCARAPPRWRRCAGRSVDSVDAGGRRRGRRRHVCAPADRRRPRRLPVLGRRSPAERSRRRPSPRGRDGPDVHRRAADRAARRPRRARRSAPCPREPAGGPSRRSARRRRAGWRRSSRCPRGSST